MGGDIATPHKAFADKDGIAAAGKNPARVGSGFEAAFADEDHVVRDLLAECFCGGNIDFEGRQIAVVNTEEACASIESALELLPTMYFHQGIDLTRFGDFQQVLERRLLEGGDDEQDCIGAGDDGFVDLDFVQDEILAQDWEPDLGADLGEVREAAVEELLVGEHGDGVGAGLFVGARHGDGIEVGRDDARGGAGFFHLGDEAQATFRAAINR